MLGCRRGIQEGGSLVIEMRPGGVAVVVKPSGDDSAVVPGSFATEVPVLEED